VKRSLLVWFVCLSVQMSAMSAPLVHLHADADHETDHHGGRSVHRHMESHDTADHNHQDGSHVRHSVPAAQDSAVTAAGEPGPQSFDGLTVAPATKIASVAWPPGGFVPWTSSSSAPHPPRLDSQVPDPPDISPPSLRGPPR
jgi:hypothetical protein